MMERIHTLWDELADFQAARADEALEHLMHALCGIGEGTNVTWFGSLRLDTLAEGDPAGGWRPGPIRSLRTTPEAASAAQAQRERLEQGAPDITTLRNLEGAGRFRAHRLRDLVDGDWFDGAYYRDYYLGVGYVDAVWVASPVNEDAESWFGIFRGPGQPVFTEAERDVLAQTLRGIKWFHRQLLLSHGLCLAATPLTPAERRVLHLLLTGLPEKLIADRIERSPHTVHDTVGSLFRKFGVKNRASLMALWLGAP